MPLSPIQPPDDAAPPPPRSVRLPLDPLLTLAVIGLGICSIATLAAATKNAIPGDPRYYVDRQIIYLVVGFIAMLILSRVDYAVLSRYKNGIYIALLFSIVAVLGLGHSAKGSQRAISLPLFSFQASELGKVLLIVSLSAFVVERARNLRDRDTTIRVMIAALIPAMFVIAQPDLGSGMVYMAIAYMLLFIAGSSWKHLAALAALVVVSAAFVLAVAPAAGVHVLKHYQVERLTAFLHPERRRRIRLPAARVEDRHRLGSEDGPGPQQRPDLKRLRPREPHRLHLRRRRRALRIRRRRAGPAALRVTDLQSPAHPRDVEGPSRVADRCRCSGYAHVPGLCQRGYDRWNHAHHRCDAAALELWRIVGDHNDVGRGPVAVHIRAGARLSSDEGPRSALLDTDVRRAPNTRLPAREAREPESGGSVLSDANAA